MEEFILRSTRAGDFLAFRAEPWDREARPYEGPTISVELVCQGLSARTTLPEYNADTERLEPLLREIDRDWRGWTGEKRAGDIDDRLAFVAAHDGLGHVVLTIFLDGEVAFVNDWSARAELSLDVGSALALANALAAWQEAIWPIAQRWRTATP